MSLEYIRDRYGVPAFEGREVEYTGHEDGPIVGRIVGGDNGRLLVDFGALTSDGPAVLHPTWRVSYVAVCDGQPACCADEHRPTCLGLYRTETEVEQGVWPALADLKRRRKNHLDLTTLGHGRTQS